MICRSWSRNDSPGRVRGAYGALSFALSLLVLQASSMAQTAVPAKTAAAEKRAQQIYSGLPLLFEKNQGQADSRVNFLSRMPNFTLFLSGPDASIVHAGKTAGGKASSVELHWMGASAISTAAGDAEIAAKTNYFKTRDSAKWHANIANYQRVMYSELYPGVDLVYYGNHSELEYDLTVAPNADPKAIKLKIDGAKKLHIDKATGDLIVRDALGGEMRLRKPVVYQASETEEHLPVAGSYVLSARNTVSFALGDYDHMKPLVIDPYVVYSTLFGGVGTQAASKNDILGMAVDAQGYVYLSGITNTLDVPTTPGAFQPACDVNTGSNGSSCLNLFLAKFDTTKSGGASLVYATYLGGAENDINGGGPSTRQAGDLAVDAAGDAYITGFSSGNDDFPTTSNGYAPSCLSAPNAPTSGGPVSCRAAFLSKLNPGGSALLYSTYFPAAPYGTNTDGSTAYGFLEPQLIRVDSNQIAYIAGITEGEPVTTDGSACNITVTPGCEVDFISAFDTKKSGTASLVYSEIVDLFQALDSISVDSIGNIYGAGPYSSTYFQTSSGPLVLNLQTFSFNGFQATPSVSGGNGPVFFRLNPAGAPVYATYVGSSTSGSYGTLTAASAAENGVAYFGGFNIIAPVAQVNGLSAPSGNSQGSYVGKVDTTQTGAASLLYGTYVVAQDSSTAFIYSIGSNATGQVAFVGPQTYDEPNIQVNPVYQPADSNLGQGFAGILDTTKSGDSALTFFSYLNGTATASFGGINAVAFDPSNDLIVGGTANTSDFYATPGTFQTGVGSQNAPTPFFYKISFASSQLSISPVSLSFGNQTENVASTPQPVSVLNTGTTPITFSGIATTAQFTEADDCSPSIAAGAACTVNVTFTPNAVAAATGTLTLTDNDISLYQLVSLSGTGITPVPVATFNPTSVPFGNQVINTTSGSNVVTLTNTGTGPLTGIAVSITGTNASSFGYSNACGTTLAVNASCTVSVNFTPSSVASYSAALSFSDNASPSTQSVPLTGAGVSAATYTVSLSTTYVALSGVIGTTSAPQPVTLTNTGTGTINILSTSIVNDTTNMLAISSTTCGTTLIASANCTIYVTATPKSGGTNYGFLSISDNATGGGQSVEFAVTAPYPLALSNVTGGSYALYATNLSVTSSALSTTASGGSYPYSFTYSFPVGSGAWSLSNNYGTASLDGAPLYTGAINYSITVTDAAGATATRTGTLNVYQILPTTTFTATPTAVPGGTNLSFAVNEVPPATSVTPASPTGNVSYLIDNAGAATMLLLSGGATGTTNQSFDVLYHEIDASYSGDPNYYASGGPTIYAINGNRAQTISFVGGLVASAGTTIALAAHASSGLPVTYSVVSGPASIDASGANLVTNGAGTIVVQASQSGNTSFAAATTASANFSTY